MSKVQGGCACRLAQTFGSCLCCWQAVEMEDFDLAHRLKQPWPQQRLGNDQSRVPNRAANFSYPACRREPAATLRLTAARQSCLASSSATPFCQDVATSLALHRLARMRRPLAKRRSGTHARRVGLGPVAEADTEERKRLRNQEEEVIPAPFGQ